MIDMAHVRRERGGGEAGGIDLRGPTLLVSCALHRSSPLLLACPYTAAKRLKENQSRNRHRCSIRPTPYPLAA